MKVSDIVGSTNYSGKYARRSADTPGKKELTDSNLDNIFQETEVDLPRG